MYIVPKGEPLPDDRQLLKMAREATFMGMSYRGFQVGCAVLACNPLSGLWEVITSANVKPLSHWPKVCAERSAISYATMVCGFNRILRMAVVGMPQPEEQTPTLHPCAVCRQWFQQEPALRSDTQVILAHANPQVNVTEVLSLAALLAMHR